MSNPKSERPVSLLEKIKSDCSALIFQFQDLIRLSGEEKDPNKELEYRTKKRKELTSYLNKAEGCMRNLEKIIDFSPNFPILEETSKQIEDMEKEKRRNRATCDFLYRRQFDVINCHYDQFEVPLAESILTSCIEFSLSLILSSIAEYSEMNSIYDPFKKEETPAFTNEYNKELERKLLVLIAKSQLSHCIYLNRVEDLQQYICHPYGFHQSSFFSNVNFEDMSQSHDIEAKIKEFYEHMNVLPLIKKNRQLSSLVDHIQFVTVEDNQLILMSFHYSLIYTLYVFDSFPLLF